MLTKKDYLTKIMFILMVNVIAACVIITIVRDEVGEM
jgi:hypothetical protein